MKIAITAQNDRLDAEIDPRFGRCAYFIIFDTITKQFEAIQNPNQDARSGAGIQAGQFMIEKGIKKVLTGKVGPNAERVLKSAGIDIVTDLKKTVKEAIQSVE
ncbi:MAG: NifB/NifX family molybdenum-iron cluster-binding protein [Gammaproteobacteria bacterium]|nr:NifB/NifX family molybdenum-iron cluster-binding protein [Gammaproteobacteria bacterium]